MRKRAKTGRKKIAGQRFVHTHSQLAKKFSLERGLYLILKKNSKSGHSGVGRDHNAAWATTRFRQQMRTKNQTLSTPKKVEEKEIDLCLFYHIRALWGWREEQSIMQVVQNLKKRGKIISSNRMACLFFFVISFLTLDFVGNDEWTGMSSNIMFLQDQKIGRQQLCVEVSRRKIIEFQVE
jgi:hypothetical protein